MSNNTNGLFPRRAILHVGMLLRDFYLISRGSEMNHFSVMYMRGLVNPYHTKRKR